MTFSSVSDLAQNMMFRRQGADLKTSLSRLTQELTTGKRQDLSNHLDGDFGALSAFKRTASRLDAFSQARADVVIKVDAIQTALQGLTEGIGNFGTVLSSAASLEQTAVLDAQSATALSRLDQAVSLLNTQSAGQYVFSGVNSSQPALNSTENIMNELRLVATTATDATDLQAKVNDWFMSAGGGFETIAYLAGGQAIENITISDDRRISLPVKGDDSVFRKMLSDLAITALVSEAVIPMSFDEKRSLISKAGTGLAAVNNGLINMQSDYGIAQGVLEETELQSRVESNVVSLAISTIEEADQFEAASALEAVQYQIESLYVLTARTAQLRLTDYLR